MKLVSVNASSTLADSDVPNKAWIEANVSGGGVSQSVVDAGDYKTLKYALPSDTLFRMKQHSKLNGFYDDFYTTDDYELTGSTVVLGNVASGAGTIATKSTSIADVPGTFYLYPIEDLGTGSITYAYSKDGTTWTLLTQKTEVTVSGAGSTFQVRASLSGDARLIGWAVIY